MKHTPGQWFAFGYWVKHPDDTVADICNCNPASMGQELIVRKDEEIRANARLIAAAPELLDALKALVEDLEVRSVRGVVACGNSIYVAAHKAIAKAEGLK